MVATATSMMRRGLSPSVSEVAEAAGVSRSTAYRYFPTQSDMLRAVVAEALGPILDWQDAARESEARLASLYGLTFPRLAAHEATFRAALRQSLEEGEAAEDHGAFGRGHRRGLLSRALAEEKLPLEVEARLIPALSMTFGIEAMVVLKDICGLTDDEARDVALWSARALLAAARQQAAVSS